MQTQPSGGVSAGETIRVPLLVHRLEEQSSVDVGGNNNEDSGTSIGSFPTEGPEHRKNSRSKNKNENKNMTNNKNYDPTKLADDSIHGEWKAGICSCFHEGICHRDLWSAWLCPQILLGQILVRTKLTWMAEPENCSGRRRKQKQTSSKASFLLRWAYRIFFFLVVATSFYGIDYLQLHQRDEPIDFSFSFRALEIFWWQELVSFVLSLPLTIWVLVVVVRLRKAIRNEYNIPPARIQCCNDPALCNLSLGNSEDMACALCCSCCMLGQMARQTADLEGDESTPNCSMSGHTSIESNSNSCKNDQDEEEDLPSKLQQIGDENDSNSSKNWFGCFQKRVRNSLPDSKPEPPLTVRPPSPSHSLSSNGSPLRHRLARHILIATFVFQCSTSDAFTAQPPSLTLPIESKTWLFAKKKRKQKPARSNGQSNGGTGFGVISKKKVKPTDSTGLPSDETPELGVVATNDMSEQRENYLKIYNQEFLEQALLENASLPQRLVQISSDPLIFTIDDFIDPVLCKRVQSNGAGCFNLLFPERVADLVFNGQENEMDGLLFNQASSQEHDKIVGPYPDGLHVDTNNECLERHVTCILYLNDVPDQCGGATVFPLARALPDDPALMAAHRLLMQQISHTRHSKSAGTANALLLESRVETNFANNPNSNTAIRIQPKAGRLLVFFSRQSNGKQDPRSWHAGERIREHKSNNKNSVCTEKRILTLFKQVDCVDDNDKLSQEMNTFEDRIAPMIREQRNWLKTLALTKTKIEYLSTTQ